MDRTAVSTAVLISFLIVAASSQASEDQDVDIYSFHINSTVTSRYAITVITSRVANRVNKPKEVFFEVKIPKNAFISKFRMTIEEKTYDGVVQEKKAAQQQYSQAISRGESAGMVSSVGRTLENFRTSVAVAALSKVTFELTYEELLKRSLGRYQLLINAQPTQPVADFKIDVYIRESAGISFLDVKGGLNTKDLTNAVTTTQSETEVWVTFYPTREQQTKCAVCGSKGMNGDLLITYDVERSKPSGDLQASNGYFVHYFAPTDLHRIPKNVVFVIDQSGSMFGRKMQQTREALVKILGDIAEDDYFGLITFDHEIYVWQPEIFQATELNLKSAKDFVKKIQERGATNINSAVLKGVDMIKKHKREGSASILILLTDGAPNTGESNPARIQANVRDAIGGRFPLYCLGFGNDVNFDFLSKMALENNGQALRIYEDSDADLQLQGFYKTVAIPLLIDVNMRYPGAANLTQTTFRYYYNGSEIVVAGQITDNSLETFQTEVIAMSKNNEVTYEDSVSTKEEELSPGQEHVLQRLWAYLTVKQLLEKETTLSGQEKDAAREEALNLSLKYQFVTPLTSMLVTKPQGEDTQVADKPKEGERSNHRRSAVSGHAGTYRSQAGKSQSFPRSPGWSRLQPAARIRGLRTGVSGFQVQDKQSDSNHQAKRARIIRPTPPPPMSDGRFLISTRGQPKPLCYDLPVNSKLCLLLDPSSDFSMNGRLSSKGFKRIVLYYKTNHVLTLSTTSIRYSDGLNNVTFLWGETSTKHGEDSVFLILRNNEMDVSMGTVRVVFLRHKKDGERFLWPAVQQQPNTTNIQGVFGKKNLQYEERPGSLIRIKDKEGKATWSTAKDLRRATAPVLGCWLVPFHLVLQGKLSDFTVSQL